MPGDLALPEADLAIPQEGLPPPLQASLARHRENLAGMMGALRAVGLDDQAIEAHLSTLIDSYRAELSAAIAGLRASA